MEGLSDTEMLRCLDEGETQVAAGTYGTGDVSISLCNTRGIV